MSHYLLHNQVWFGSVLIVVVMAFIPSNLNELSDLERRVAELDRRVAQLEQQKGVVHDSRPAQVNTNRGFENIENWRRLKTDMTPSQVDALLGKPTRINGGGVAMWFYSNNRISGSVTFINDKLSSWSEPR